MSHYKYHVFVCTNRRDGGRKCCQNADADRILDYAKRRVKELNLVGPGAVRVNGSGCMDRCIQGPAIAIYPEAVWYTYRDEADLDEIITTHLVDGKIVDRLRMADIVGSKPDSPSKENLK